MKRLLLATVALAALAAPAAAADLAVKYPVKAVPVPVQVFSWTGFYIGANAGYGGNNIDQTGSASDTTPNPNFGSVFAPLGSSQTIAGFFAGGQIGYNYQFANNVVVGLEADLQWSDISGSNGAFANDFAVVPFGVVSGSANTKVEYFGTIRARLGYAFDRFLPYITGGAAYGKVKNSFAGAYTYTGPGPDYADFAWGDASSTSWGWTVGGGFEYAITNNWTVKTEYLYVDLGSNDIYNAPIGRLDNAYLNGDAKFHTVKAGVNYKF